MYRYIYLSIDPGTSMLGATINAITMDNRWVVLHSCTTNIKALIQHKYPANLIALHGERYFKSQLCHEVVYKFADSWDVNSIVSESPYMGKFPQAFSALTECLQSIRMAAYHYNPHVPLDTIDPATIKNHVGVKGNSGNKDHMTNAIAQLAGHMVDVTYLDEHAIDSIAVGYAWYQSRWLKQNKR